MAAVERRGEGATANVAPEEITPELLAGSSGHEKDHGQQTMRLSPDETCTVKADAAGGPVHAVARGVTVCTIREGWVINGLLYRLLINTPPSTENQAGPIKLSEAALLEIYQYSFSPEEIDAALQLLIRARIVRTAILAGHEVLLGVKEDAAPERTRRGGRPRI